MSRLQARFAELKQQNRAALVTFVTAGDPGYDTSLAILKGLPKAGADVIELGMPFTDPMADGPAIQLANIRALAAQQNLAKTLQMVREFRAENNETPLVLMGYFNPIHYYGVPRFIADAQAAGVDGLIVVDLPPEHNNELCDPAQAAGLDFIRLTTPTTDDARLPTVLNGSSGFVYYVSVAGAHTGAGCRYRPPGGWRGGRLGADRPDRQGRKRRTSRRRRAEPVRGTGARGARGAQLIHRVTGNTRRASALQR